jgi:nucleoside 2-deoxyribosyltransferase
MKIYFGASVSFNRKYLPKYQLIVRKIKQLGHEVLSEHVVDPKLKAGEGLNPKKLFEKEIRKIDQADLMIAEVTVPSWGTAFLMEHALKEKKPVLALFYKDNGYKIPPMIQGHPELYVESYDEDNIKTVLKFNLKHFGLEMSRKGKLIVIDGTNASGKATQTQLLISYFSRHKIKAKQISFPRYYTSFHGKTVCRFLKGEFGRLQDINPYLSSLAFALDRLTAKNQIVDWLEKGYIVIADRYVTSSLAHQGAKLSSRERTKFVNWVYDMEYKQHRMPKEFSPLSLCSAGS